MVRSSLARYKFRRAVFSIDRDGVFFWGEFARTFPRCSVVFGAVMGRRSEIYCFEICSGPSFYGGDKVTKDSYGGGRKGLCIF